MQEVELTRLIKASEDGDLDAAAQLYRWALRSGDPERSELARRTLEAPLLEHPNETQAWRYYASVLRAVGDPRGELIDLSLDSGDSMRHLDRMAAIISKNRMLWAGQAMMDVLKGKLTLMRVDQVKWRFGFIVETELVAEPNARTCDFDQAAQALTDAPAARLLNKLRLSMDLRNWGELDYSPALSILATRRWEALRTLEIRGSVGHTHTAPNHPTTNVARMLDAAPRLQRLILSNRSLELGTLTHSTLEELRLSQDDFTPNNIASWLSADLPALKRLSLNIYGARHELDRSVDRFLSGLRRVLRREEGFQHLAHLHIGGQKRGLDRILATLLTAPLLAGLESLHIEGYLTRTALQMLKEQAAKLQHLEELIVWDNPPELRALLPNLRARA